MSLGEIFMRFVNAAIAASWLVLAVLLLRLVLKKAPRRLICLLWAVVAVRLVLPVSIESPVSLVPSAETFPVEKIYSAAREDATDKSAWHVDTGFEKLNGEAVDELLMPGTASGNWLRSEALGVLWVVGVSGMLLYALASLLRLRRRVATAVLTEPRVKRSENVESPFVMGIFRPTIYLPFAVEEADLPYILAHERAHIQRMDHVWKPLGFALLAVYWFNPLFWIAYALFCRDLETACDERVCRDFELFERRAYSTALLNCAVRKSAFSAPLAFGEVGVKERIRGVMNHKKPAFWLMLLAIIAVVAAAVFFLTNPIPAGSPLGRTFTAQVVDAYFDDYEPPERVSVTSDGVLQLYEDGAFTDVGTLTEGSLPKNGLGQWFWGDQYARFRSGNRKTWVYKDFDTEILYYLLWQKNGDVYFLGGWADPEGKTDPYSDDSNVNAVLKLTELDPAAPFGRTFRAQWQENWFSQNMHTLNTRFGVGVDGTFYVYDSLGVEAYEKGKLIETELTAESFDGWCKSEDLDQLRVTPGEIREKNARAWRTEPEDSGMMRYILLQENGDWYYVEVYPDREELGIVMKLTDATASMLLYPEPTEDFGADTDDYGWLTGSDWSAVQSVAASAGEWTLDASANHESFLYDFSLRPDVGRYYYFVSLTQNVLMRYDRVDPALNEYAKLSDAEISVLEDIFTRRELFDHEGNRR